jgi:chemotaxis protein methyltransferase CheR
MTRADVERFRTVVAQHLGFRFDDAKLDSLAEVLNERVERARDGHVDAYLSRLASPARGREELRLLADRLTVAETYFFRNPDQLRAFADVVLGRRPLRILSAGCASGEEAYSLAILARERLGELAGRETTILGIDVNPSMIEKAERARYSEWSLRQTPDDLRARYFRSEGRDDIVLDERVRAMVTFAERNLVRDDPAFWQPDSFDAIFCRNVIMYFRPEVARAVVARMTQALTRDGFLFLGHAETLRGISHDFHLRHTHETFYYRRRTAVESDLPFEPQQAAPSPPLPAAALELGEAWMEAIDRSAERIAALAHGARRSRAAADAGRVDTPRAAPGSRWDLGLPVDLLRRERFADAIASLGALPPESRHDSDVQLLRAVVLTNAGDLGEARRVCEQLLELDGLNAGAHYLMALCLERAGEREAAVEHDRTAVYLDSAFAMPHLHLGLTARRAGDVATARRELEQALALLEREDPSRVLLFGGGFSREALIALCRAELRGCGAAA